ncbi:Eaa protein [Salmonella enterica]|uniref:Eaa protein n=1 Tax=Salmonella enterica TaxID=28901 RepID=UPI0034510DB5
MSNNKLTDRKIAEILARAEICDDSVLTDYTDIAAAMRELQERRRLDGIQHAVCEVCGVPCNNPNHPQMAVAHEYSAQPVPVVSFYRDGIEAAASWVDKQRQAFDNEHGRYDSDTGAFEFGNDTLHDWSYALAELADGIRGLHPNAGGNSPVIPDGWKLAPEKADEDMIAEGKIMASCMIETVGKIDVSLIYGAMLAAAPEKETGLCTK